MSTRVSLVDRLEKDQHELDPEVEAAFVKRGNVVPHAREASPDETERHQATPGVDTQPKPARRPKQSAAITPGLIPVNVRVRPELAGALQDRVTRSPDAGYPAAFQTGNRRTSPRTLAAKPRISGGLTTDTRLRITGITSSAAGSPPAAVVNSRTTLSSEARRIRLRIR